MPYNGNILKGGIGVRTVLFAARLTRELAGSEQKILFSCLPPERWTRFVEGKSHAGRDEILCAYGLLCAALRRELDWRTLPAVALSDAGKPFFPDFPDVHFSLSHADGAVMVGLSPAPIGVDIEKAHPVRARLMRRVADTDDPEQFFRHWVALEAVGKRDGGGVPSALNSGASPLSDAGCHLLYTWPGYFAAAAYSSGYAAAETHLYTV